MMMMMMLDDPIALDDSRWSGAFVPVIAIESTARPHKATSTSIRPPVFYPIRRRAPGRPARPHRGKFRPAGLRRDGRRRGEHRKVAPTTVIRWGATWMTA